MPEPLIRNVWRSTRSTCPPITSMVFKMARISLTSGTFSTVTVSFVMIDAAKIASAAFLAPAISTSPDREFPPFTI